MNKQIPYKYQSLIFRLHYKMGHDTLLFDRVVKGMKN